MSCHVSRLSAPRVSANDAQLAHTTHRNCAMSVLLSGYITDEQTHTEKKRHTCSFCPKRFTGRSETKEHERTHTGEKPYGCSYCDMRFTQGGNMRRHERVHTGEKRFGCRFCPMKFSQRNNAINHEDKKHGFTAPK